MKVLLFGSDGQLGWELQRTCPGNIEIVTCDYPKVDFCSTHTIEKCINSIQPDCIINAAAYTAVDKAEQETDLAYRINHEAVSKIAELCRKNTIFMVQVSTDFVFNGRNFKPHNPYDTPSPESVYGKSKREGEKAVLDILSDNALLIRTAWLYSSHGNNFVRTMIHLMKEKERLNVVDEQIGTPTWAFGLALSIWVSIEKNLTGIFHWTDAGVASWYDFAMAIQEEGLEAGLLEKSIPILPVTVKQFPTPAKRPYYSILDKRSFLQATGLKPLHWRVQLRSMLEELV
ncbi:MAG: dTDP-4-dehydrorhamnose reductase [Desulfobacteraceae bacterium]|nr:dTDP-4-dehydrorhamnose reductase [Desulfobacteraceae bacterium]